VKRKFLIRFLKSLVILFLNLVVGLLLVEGIVRVRQWVKYGTWKSTAYNFKVDPVSGLTVPVPGQHTRKIWINSLGFRGPELVNPKPIRRIRLAFLGGSTTFCAEVSGDEVTWPHLVWKTFQDTWPYLEFDYINAGVPGYGIKSILRNLEYRIKPLQPDVIVIYEATNDLSKDTRELARKQGLFAGKVEDLSPFARWSTAWYLIEKNLQIRVRQMRAAQGIERLEFDPRTLSEGFYQRLRELIETSQKISPVVAVATFSHKVRREQSPEERLRASNTSLYYMPYMSVEGILEGFEEYNRVIREVAQEAGVTLVEGEYTIPGDDRHFNDSVHFKDPGSELMARRVVSALTHSETFKKLIESHCNLAQGRCLPVAQ
jgi:lysophospholipase L1-like esterase